MNTKILDADAETGTLFLEREVWDMEALQYRKIRTRAVWNAAAGLYEETETETSRSIRDFGSGVGFGRGASARKKRICRLRTRIGKRELPDFCPLD